MIKRLRTLGGVREGRLCLQPGGQLHPMATRGCYEAGVGVSGGRGPSRHRQAHAARRAATGNSLGNIQQAGRNESVRSAGEVGAGAAATTLLEAPISTRTGRTCKFAVSTRLQARCLSRSRQRRTWRRHERMSTTCPEHMRPFYYDKLKSQ